MSVYLIGPDFAHCSVLLPAMRIPVWLADQSSQRTDAELGTKAHFGSRICRGAADNDYLSLVYASKLAPSL